MVGWDEWISIIGSVYWVCVCVCVCVHMPIEISTYLRVPTPYLMNGTRYAPELSFEVPCCGFFRIGDGGG